MIRIISGSARGRKLETPEGLETRPTLDRVKEAMFGSLQFDIPNSRVLDLFSGSGNLGLEAASRGAASVILNDSNRACADIIRKNACLIGLDKVITVMNCDYRTAIEILEQKKEAFDIVFLDPPYRGDAAQNACEELFRRGLIRKGGTVVIEFGTEFAGPHGLEGLMRVQKTKRYGSCGFALMKGEES